MNNDKHIRGFTNVTPASRLGIDIGRVILCPTLDDGTADTSFLGATDEAAMETPPAPGMFEVVPTLAHAFQGRVWLVSKAGPRIEALTRRWLSRHRFFERIGVAPTHLCFCRKRPEKRQHAERLRLTHFIDDRIDVLQHLRGAVPNLVLFGVQNSPLPPWAWHVVDWRILGQSFAGQHMHAAPR